MAYISNFLPSDFDKLAPHLLRQNEILEMERRKKEKEDKMIEFRNSSDIQLEKKPCPCMANNIKSPESS